MDDLISRQDIEWHHYLVADGNGMYHDEKVAYKSQIDDLPSAQPEIIRCKDCKHYEIWQLKSDYTDDKRYKPSVCIVGRYAVHRSEDWFCADAERRTDDSGSPATTVSQS